MAKEDGDTKTAGPVIPSTTKSESIDVMAKERKCTDLCCLFLFIIFWIGMFIILGVASANGRPEKLIYGTDWKGRTCGSQKKSNDSTVESYDFRDYKYIYYPRLQEDLYQMQLASITSKSSNFFNFLTGICVKQCPVLPPAASNETSSIELYAHAYSYENYDKDPINTDNSSTYDAHVQSPWRVNLNSTGIFYRCLTLEKVETEVSVRCIDPCKENQTTYCGKASSNQFISCGGSDCKKTIEQHFPECATTQHSELSITTGDAHPSPIYDSLTSGWRLVSQWLGDLQKSIVPILVCGGLAAIVVSFVWIILMKYCAGVMVWGTIISVIAVFLGTTVYLCYRGDLIPTSKVASYMDQYNITINTQYLDRLDTTVNNYASLDTANKKHFWAVSAYVFIAIDLLLFCFIIAMTSHVNIAIGIVKQASKAIRKMPSLLLFPIAPTVAVIALVIYWIVVSAYIATAGKIKVGSVTDIINEKANQNLTQYYDGFTKYEDKNVVRYLILYHLFGFLWTSELLQSIGYMIVAGAICKYYWTRDKKELGWFPVIESIWRVFRYHLGTICFGSLIIAVIQLVRIILEYVDKKTKELQNSNGIIKVIVKCLKCCLWCFEKCLQFINRNAYIITAMKGTSFVTSVKTAFSLLFENAARVGTVSVISFLILLLAKLCITCLCCVLMFVFIHNPPKKLPTIVLGDLDDISSPIFPMIMTGLMSYAIATAFIGIYETTIDTILLCFCEDCRINKESGDYYMSKGMRKYIDGDAQKYAFSHYNKDEQKQKTEKK